MKILTSYIFLLSLFLAPCVVFAQDGSSVSSAKRIEFSTNADPNVSPLNGASYPVNRIVPVMMTFVKDTADQIIGFSFDCRVYDPSGMPVMADTIMLSGGWDKGYLDFEDFMPTQPGTYRLVFGVWDAGSTYRDSVVSTIVAVAGKRPDLRFSNPGGPGSHPRRDSSYHHTPVIPVRMMVVNRADVTATGAMISVMIGRGGTSVYNASAPIPTIGANDSAFAACANFDPFPLTEGTYCLYLHLWDGNTAIDSASWCFTLLPDPQDNPKLELGRPSAATSLPRADSTYLESSTIRPRIAVTNKGASPAPAFIVTTEIFNGKTSVYTDQISSRLPVPGDSRVLAPSLFSAQDTGGHRVVYRVIFREAVIDSVSWGFYVAIDTSVRSSRKFRIGEPETLPRYPVREGVYNLGAEVPVSAFVVNDDATLSGKSVTLRGSIVNSGGGPVYGREAYQAAIGPGATVEMELPDFRSNLPGRFHIVMSILQGATVIDVKEWDFTISQSTGVENPAERAAGPIVRPNPARERAVVTLTEGAGSMIAISLCDVTGAEIRRFESPARTGLDGFEVDLRGLPAGVYMVRGISASGATSGTRLVVMP